MRISTDLIRFDLHDASVDSIDINGAEQTLTLTLRLCDAMDEEESRLRGGFFGSQACFSSLVCRYCA